MDVKINKVKAKGESIRRLIQSAQAAGKVGAQATPGIREGAERAVKFARAADPFFKAVARHAQGESSKGGARPSVKLVGLGKGNSNGVRANAQGSGKTSSGASRSVVIRNAEDTVVQRIPHYFRNRTPAEVSSSNKAVKALMEDAPVAEGTLMHAIPQAEHEYMDDKRGRVVRAVGSMLLDTLSTGAANYDKGNRVGIYLISPATLGGRLGLLSKMFEQHKAIKCTLMYCPVVPSTTTGAFMMYAQNDVSAYSTDVGTDELRHAATHPDWMEVAVWRQGVFEVNPSNVNLRYFDSELNPVDAIQSLLQVECADTMAPNLDYGNLFLHYDFEFYSESLDYREGQVLTPIISLVVNAIATSQGNQIYAPFTSTHLPGTVSWNYSNSDFPASANQVFYGVVTEVIGQPLAFFTAANATEIPIVPGQGLYVGTTGAVPGNNWTNGSIVGVLYAQLPDGDIVQGCLYSVGTTSTTSTVKMQMRALDLGDVF